jgi:hypothetical protein
MRSSIVGSDKSGQVLAHQQMPLAGPIIFLKKVNGVDDMSSDPITFRKI